MATLLSPGVSVTIIDETVNVGANPGTIPLIVFASAENKTIPDGTGIASGTIKSASNKIFAVTSQREVLQLFGNPIFNSIGGTPVNGDPTNEYGLLSAHSYLGASNLVYMVRADIDLNKLQPSINEPTTPADAGTLWLDMTETKLGLFKNNGTAYVSEAVDRIFLEEDVSVIVPTNDDVDAVGYGDGIMTYYYHETIPGTGGDPDVEIWSSDLPGYRVGPIWPNAGVSGDYWLKTTAAANGADYKVKRKSATTGEWELLECPALASESDAATYYGSRLQIGRIFAEYDTTTAQVLFKQVTSVSPVTWSLMSDLIGSYLPPVGGPVNDSYWYNPEIGVDGQGKSSVDILVNTTMNKWESVNLPGYHFTASTGAALPAFQDTLPVLYMQPFNPIDGAIFPHVSGVLANGDLWIDTREVDNYPLIYKYRSGVWVQINLADQSTPDGILFRDARPSPDFIAAVGAPVKQDDPDLDPDAPDSAEYAIGTLLWNTRFSSRNVKVFHENYVYQGVTVGPRWVSISGNNLDGSPIFGSNAQKAVITTAINETLVSNEDLRSENIFYNLLAVPGYPEVTQSMITLGIDRKETLFILGDTPMSLPSQSTAIQNWVTNANNATVTGDDGIVTSYSYISFNYPGAALTTNVDGSTVVVPSTHAALRTYAYNDQVSYQWYAPAGEARGVVTNATSVGFIDGEGEYVPVGLTNAQRDLLYVNNINPIAQFPGQNPMFYGQKTRNLTDSALSRVNVARLVVYLREMLDRMSRRFLFEFNDSITRKSFKDVVDKFLGELITLRALTDFITVCDGSNNTPARIDRNELWMDIAIQPNRVAEFIYIPIRLRNTGSF
jgi:hypothetical protein